MIMDRNLRHHPKFLLFKRSLGAADAMEYLCSLWGHCEVDQRGDNWGKVDASYIEATCGWNGEPGKLFECLAAKFCNKPGWITVKGRGEVQIVGWAERNARLISNWNHGPKGGRPRKATQGKPKDNPRVSHGFADGNQMRGDEKRGEESRNAPPPLPEVSVPNLAEIIAHGNGPAGIPPDFCRKFFDYHSNKNSWFNGRGQLINWQRELGTWWAKDRHTWTPEKNPAAGRNLDQLEAELDAETDPEKRRRLADQIKKAA